MENLLYELGLHTSIAVKIKGNRGFDTDFGLKLMGSADFSF
jgi:hypothetical protein